MSCSASRREFLKNTSWLGLTALAAGCAGPQFGFGTGGSMHGFAMRPMKRIRVGIVGVGSRGGWAVQRVCRLPGVEVAAICDRKDHKLAERSNWLLENKFPAPRTYGGEEGWKALCESDDIDVVYVATPWKLHVPVALRALRNGKVALVEVPAAFTVDECWELVETSEKMRIPCMQLENCCYGEIEMLEFNLVRLGLLGELVHCEGGYIHDLRAHCCVDGRDGENEWRYGENLEHKGNRYPTHGLVPLCLTFDINRGDRFDYLVSLESRQENFEAFMRSNMPENHLRRGDHVAMGDMNMTLIKTVKGRSFLLQHDVSTPRPYSRLSFISGTKGAVGDYPFRVALEEKSGSGAHEWFDEKKTAEIREKYKHPIWRQMGEIAKKVGGHGGMDFIMDLRWAYCLQNGLPLDMDVYDLATTSCLCELTEKSVRGRSNSMTIPDFTCGGWRNARPMDVVSFDMTKIGLDTREVKDAKPMTI